MSYRKKYFSAEGMIIVSLLGIVGLLFCLYPAIFNFYNHESFYNIVAKSGMEIIIGSFFIIISIYCWVAFFVNIVLSPKKDILFLIKNENYLSIFVNKKGKKFIFENTKKKELNFYYVIKTRDYIYEVLEEECKLDEIWEEKKSYWFNLYSPIGNFENMFLLPMFYVILLPGILSILMSKGFDKIYGLIYSAVPFYMIVYDFVYKLKLKNNNMNDEDENKFANSYILLRRFIIIILMGIMIYILTIVFLKFQNSVLKNFSIPLYLCGILACATVIAKVFDMDYLYKLFLKIYVIIFLLFWFGFTTFAIIGFIKQEDNYIYILIERCLTGRVPILNMYKVNF